MGNAASELYGTVDLRKGVYSGKQCKEDTYEQRNGNTWGR